jgi:DNA-directed RNA polymerase sigma subunit (sigma70/sigma32)
MPKAEVEKRLVVAERQAIFLALVETQDGAVSVVQSRKTVAERFAISEERVRCIEQEGLDAGWPPLE